MDVYEKAKSMYKKYSGAVAYLEVEAPDGTLSIGSSFHVGEGVFITARHVIDGKKIRSVGVDVNSAFKSTELFGTGIKVSDVFFHPDETVDIGALVIQGISCPALPLGSHLDD